MGGFRLKGLRQGKEALMKRYDYRRKFRTCKPAEGESPDMIIVRIVTYLDKWIELSKTDRARTVHGCMSRRSSYELV
ncbi:hypothetical protein PoB_006829000 [Plakobranchus ocellatus]|uniref:Uncharacterized protein n=1 Tax=Plakobranchus ocellatus TaxID=259542 RepID=A0AAV4DCH5_9GAST|nr:hypothetical protein PoB_006829000 [Plakobranchus ocellatus]